MPLLHLIGVLIVVAVVLWAVNTFGAQFMEATILKLINIVVIVAVVLWVVSVFFGLSFADIRVGR